MYTISIQSENIFTKQLRRSEVSENEAVREQALRLAIECGDQAMIQYISELIKGGAQDEPKNPPPPPQSHRNQMGNPEKPEAPFTSASQTLSPEIPNVESAAHNLEASFTSSSLTVTSTQVEGKGIEPQMSSSNMNPLRSSTNPEERLPVYEQAQQGQAAGNNAIPPKLIGEFNNLVVLKEQVLLAEIQNLSPSIIAARQTQYDTASAAFNQKMAIHDANERGWSNMDELIRARGADPAPRPPLPRDLEGGRSYAASIRGSSCCNIVRLFLTSTFLTEHCRSYSGSSSGLCSSLG